MWPYQTSWSLNAWICLSSKLASLHSNYKSLNSKPAQALKSTLLILFVVLWCCESYALLVWNTHIQHLSQTKLAAFKFFSLPSILVQFKYGISLRWIRDASDCLHIQSVKPPLQQVPSLPMPFSGLREEVQSWLAIYVDHSRRRQWNQGSQGTPVKS